MPQNVKIAGTVLGIQCVNMIAQYKILLILLSTETTVALLNRAEGHDEATVPQGHNKKKTKYCQW